MQTIEGQALDAAHIKLMQPISTKPGAKIIVIIPSAEDLADERNAWLQLCLQNLQRAYGENEPNYGVALMKEPDLAYQFAHAPGLPEESNHKQKESEIKPPLSNIQLELLKVYAAGVDERYLSELKDLIGNFLLSKAREAADKIWQERDYQAETVEKWLTQK